MKTVEPEEVTPPQLVVIGVGLEGWTGLSTTAQSHIQESAVLIGSDRQLALIPTTETNAERWTLGKLSNTFERLEQYISKNPVKVVILGSGDPLFFGIGRLILEKFPTDRVTFLPNLSSVQLAFSAIKQPWQNATVISLHGRSPDELIKAVRRGDHTIALLTDHVYTPAAIASLIEPWIPAEGYQLWLCENLGGDNETIRRYALGFSLGQETLRSLTVAPLNVVILQRQEEWNIAKVKLPQLPLLGIDDRKFVGFRDRPGLMTKREIRILILGMLQLQRNHTIWDIGSGTGSVAIEIARLCPEGKVCAIEKTAVGIELIRKNVRRFSLLKSNVTVVAGEAPKALTQLPAPNRIFIGGSGGELGEILDFSFQKLLPEGKVIIALATLERTQELQNWHQKAQKKLSLEGWTLSLEWTQINITRSVPVGPLTRWSPLNPVTLATLEWRSIR